MGIVMLYLVVVMVMDQGGRIGTRGMENKDHSLVVLTIGK